MKKIIFALACLMCAAQGFAQEKTPQENGEVYKVVQQVPEYPGGNIEMRKFIRKHFRYPKLPAMLGIEGQVFVLFVVNAKGGIMDIVTSKKVGYGLDEEAMRLVQIMPDWNAGKQNDAPVNAVCTLPISFKLPEEDNKISWEEQLLFVNGKPVGKVKDNEPLIRDITIKNTPFTLKKKKGKAYISLK